MELEVELIIGRLSSLTDPCSNNACKPKDKKNSQTSKQGRYEMQMAIQDQRTCWNEALHVIVGARSAWK